MLQVKYVYTCIQQKITRASDAGARPCRNTSRPSTMDAKTPCTCTHLVGREQNTCLT